MNYNATLRAAIAAAIHTPADPPITGADLQAQLLSIVDGLDLGALLLGVATPSLTPNTEANGFYFAFQSGTYTNFPTINGQTITVDSSEVAIIVRSGNYWSKIHIMTYPTIDPTTKHWMIGNEDTGVLAEGTTPHIDQETGNWMIGTYDTGIHAQGAPGKDAYQPFKGTFASVQDLNAAYPEPDDGDTAYVEDIVENKTVLKVHDVVNGEWHDTGTTADSPMFGSGQFLSSVKIDNTHLANPAEGSLPKAEDMMQPKAKLEGVTASETKVQLVTSGEGQNVYSGSVSPTTGVFIDSSQKIVIIPVSGIKSVRMLIATIRESSAAIMGYSFGNITSGEKPDSTLSNYTANHIYAFEHVGTESLPLEVTIPVPSDSSWLCVTNWVALLGNSFYAYTQVGDSVVDLIAKSKEQVEEQIDALNNEINVFKDVPSTSINGLYIAADGGINSYSNVVLRYVKVEANNRIKIIGTTTTGGSNFRMGVSAVIPANGGSVIGLEEFPGGTQNFEKDYIPAINGYFCISCLASYVSVVIEKETLAFEKEYEEQIELVLGNFNDNLGGLKGATTDDSVVMKSFISNRYKKNGGKLISVSGVRNDEVLSVFMYDASMSFLGIANDIEHVDDSCEFIALRLSKATAYNESVRLLTLNYVGSVKIDKIYYTAVPSNATRFITFEVSRTNPMEANDATYSQNAQRLYTNGYIITPPNYTKDGEPVPLAIFVHGTGGYVFNEASIEYYGELLRFVAKNGYAVVDCCTMTNLYSATTDVNGNTRTGYKDTNYPCRLSVDCYVSLYKYVTKMFNIDKERVFIWGKSSGGRLATIIGQSKLLPVKAVAILNGGLDSLTNFRVLGQDSLVAEKKLMEDDMGFTNIPSSFVVSNQPYRNPSNIPSSLIDYLLDNVDKIAGFNPLFTGISDLDIDTYERAQFTCSMAANDMDTSLTDNATIMEQVNKGFKTSLVPTKIWAAQDDENVPYPMAVIYTKLVKRGGGICELRTIPAGNGKHWAVDIAQPNLGKLYPGTGFPNDLPYAPKTSYVTKFGETISEVTVTYAELVDWFNRW